MKKLLAIAVAAAITAPMAAMADTTAYGKAHVSIAKTESISGLSVNSHSSRIGLKGSNALDNGLTATHKFELGYNITDKVKDGGLTDRDAWVGLKGGFGEVRFGRHTTPYSIVDDATTFVTRNDHALHTFQRANNVMAYINKFGSVGVAAAYVPAGQAEGGNKSDGVFDGMINYSAGPLYAGLGYSKLTDVDAGTKVALAYKGANYGVGVNFEKLPGSGDKVTTLGGKYSFGKAYIAGQFGKNKDTDVKQKNVEIGYSLGKGTKAYYEWEDLADVSSNRVGLVHNF